MAFNLPQGSTLLHFSEFFYTGAEFSGLRGIRIRVTEVVAGNPREGARFQAVVLDTERWKQDPDSPRFKEQPVGWGDTLEEAIEGCVKQAALHVDRKG